jgi:hypothetical protein
MSSALKKRDPPASNLTLSRETGARRPVSDVVPRAVLRRDALSFHLLRPAGSVGADRELLYEAYRAWSDVWKQTFYELDHKKDLPSDDFTRQDEIGALFQDGECIGLSCLRWMDLSNPIYQDDSYFAVWPQVARDAASVHGSKICVGSNFTITPPWRRAAGCSLKDVIMALVVERFLLSDADTFVGTVRNNRGMNTVTYRNGFVPIEQNIIHHGVEVDLVAFYRRGCVRTPTDATDESFVQALRPGRAPMRRLARVRERVWLERAIEEST